MNPRLQDPLSNLSYSLRRYHVDDFYLRHAPDICNQADVLDLGGNQLAKRGAFNINEISSRVTYANLSAVKQPHVLCRAECTPFSAESFDVVICSEVLEHLLEPSLVLKEIFRVLRSRGIALVCVPFLNRIHADPFDYGRYTHYYWSHALREAGFQEFSIEWQGGFWTVLVEMIRYLVSDKTMSWSPKQTWLVDGLALVFAHMKSKAIAWDLDAAKTDEGRDRTVLRPDSV